MLNISFFITHKWNLMQFIRPFKWMHTFNKYNIYNKCHKFCMVSNIFTFAAHHCATIDILIWIQWWDLYVYCFSCATFIIIWNRSVRAFISCIQNFANSHYFPISKQRNPHRPQKPPTVCLFICSNFNCSWVFYMFVWAFVCETENRKFASCLFEIKYFFLFFDESMNIILNAINS